MKTLNFGEAIEAVKSGKLIKRSGWNGKNMFVFQRPEDNIPAGVIANIKSLPDDVKKVIAKDAGVNTNQTVKFTSYLCMKAADGTIVNGWLASQTDMLAEDWEVLNLD